MVLDNELLGYLEAYMCRDFIPRIGLNVRYGYQNYPDHVRYFIVTVGVLFGDCILHRIEENGYLDPEDWDDVTVIGTRYIDRLKGLLRTRINGLKCEVDPSRTLTLLVTRTGKPNDVRILTEEVQEPLSEC